MNRRYKIAWVLNWLVAAAMGGVGIHYLVASQPMPHHLEIIGAPWSEISPGVQTLLVTLMKGTGLAGVVTAVSMAVLLAIPFRRGEPWSRGAVLAIGCTTLVPTLVGALRVQVATSHSSPWWPHLVLLALLALAFALARPGRAIANVE